MAGDALDFFLAHGAERHHAPGDVVLAPGTAPAHELLCMLRGSVAREEAGIADPQRQPAHRVGDLFPLDAVVNRRAVTSRFTAAEPVSVLAIPVEAVQALATRSAPFADFLQCQIEPLHNTPLAPVLQAGSAPHILAEQSLETPLGELAVPDPLSCRPETPVRQALDAMRRRRTGSILVTTEGGSPLGILTRHDLLERVVLAGLNLEEPMSRVMSQPLRTLTVDNTAQDAAVLMVQQGIRHVPVTRDGLLAGIVSERDLFGLQRLSLRQTSAELQNAGDVDTLRLIAPRISRLAVQLLGQGVQSRQVTDLISRLNDVLTVRLLQLEAVRHGVDLAHACWLALGSEGRSEQTIATDQDNALILSDGADAGSRETYARFARSVNESLDACGFPLCRGGIMAGSPGGCATLSEWRSRFARWMDRGAPEDVLQASVYLDFRAIAGGAHLASRLRDDVVGRARVTPRFVREMALNAVQHRIPLNWFGLVDPDSEGMLDLKLQGTLIYVDAARVYALALGLRATSTRERLIAAGRALGLAAHEYEGWVGGFEFLQMLRLRAQLQPAGGANDTRHGNRMAVERLNDIDRRTLREALRLARNLQQRLHLDYER